MPPTQKVAPNEKSSPVNEKGSVEVIGGSLNLYESRDKLVKFFQYLAKYMSWYVLTKDKSMAKLYTHVSRQLYDARSLFRLMKSMFEIKRIQIVL